MTHYFKQNAIQIYRILLGIVLAGNISDWFFNYSDKTSQLLSTAMFCLIGLAYLVFAWAFDRRILKLLFGISGAYLIIMNFTPDFTPKYFLVLVCIVAPIFAGRFFSEEEDTKESVSE